MRVGCLLDQPDRCVWCEFESDPVDGAGGQCTACWGEKRKKKIDELNLQVRLVSQLVGWLVGWLVLLT